MTEDRTIKVAIVEDQREIREGLAQLLSATPGYRCTGAYASMEEALEKLPKNLPDLLLSDIGLPGMDGIRGVGILKERHPELLILMLTVYDDNERIFDALCAGACAGTGCDASHAETAPTSSGARLRATCAMQSGSIARRWPLRQAPSCALR